MKFLSTIISLAISVVVAYSQNIKSPADYLGYSLGKQFTSHYQVVQYFNYVGAHSDRVKIISYGQTYEHRPLEVAVISSPQNISQLDNIRKNNLQRSGLEEGIPNDSDIAIVWLSYNVHGNEPNSTETAMQVLSYLVSSQDTKVTNWLDKLVVIIDPCLNPDGRDRYVNWFNMVSGANINPDIDGIEHHEGRITGRTNHYYFDLNRDWVWQTQQESVSRLKIYNQWLPQVHVDFHEEGINEQYFFAPAALPMHQLVFDYQKEMQKVFGSNNAKYFDEHGWLYVTGEVYDLLYPGYGDTYPTFNGAIGMTYEMPGNTGAGIAVTTQKGDTLTLRQRMDMHFTTSLATIETTYTHRQKLLNQFGAFFHPKKTDINYILKSSDGDKLQNLTKLLDKNGIRYFSPAAEKKLRAFSYSHNLEVSMQLKPNDLVIPQDQPKATLINVLFEKNTSLTDSMTYDLTAWSLPYAYGLEAFIYHGNLDLTTYILPAISTPKITQNPYAILLNWKSVQDAAFLSKLLKDGVRVNVSSREFWYNGQKFNAGTLIIFRIDNERRLPDYRKIVLETAQEMQRDLVPIYSGSALKTLDMGSNYINFIKTPKVALLTGKGIDPESMGTYWYFIEQELHYPLTVIDIDYLQQVDLVTYDVVICPSGSYGELQSEEKFKQIDDWVHAGGKILLAEGAIDAFTGEDKFSLVAKGDQEHENVDAGPILFPYKQRERQSVKRQIPGSIVKIKIDNTHPLAYGYEKYYYTLKDNTNFYDLLENGWNVGYIASDLDIEAGFVGSDTRKNFDKSLVFGVEERGQGQVYYLVDNPLFRGFWQNGKLFIANAIFFND